MTGPARTGIVTYIVNLDRDKERLANLLALLKDEPILDIRRVAAVEGRQLPELVRRKISGHPAWADKYVEIGCFLSHVKLWEMIARQTDEFSLVLEDDATPRGLRRLATMERPADADLVFVNDRMCEGGRGDPVTTEVFCVPFLRGLEKLNRTRRGAGTDGYILTPAGAARLLEAVNTDLCFGNIDGRLLRYCADREELDANFPDSFISKVIHDHHNPSISPRWSVIKGYCLNTPLILHGAFESTRTSQATLL